MIRIAALLLCLLFALRAHAEEPFPADQIFATIREHSVHREGKDWPAIESKYRAAIAAAKDAPARGAAVVDVFKALGDVHSSLQHAGAFYAHYEGLDPAEHERLKPLLARAAEVSGRPEAKMLAGKIAYVLVPSMIVAGADADRLAAELDALVAGLANQEPSGWIIDLRFNTGGNVAPMLLGLRSILGEGVVGKAVDSRGAVLFETTLSGSSLLVRDAEVARLGTAFPAPIASPAAVLVGPLTASSGAATALAFRGRPDTVLIGERTARGYTTGNEPFVFPDGTLLNLSTSFMADRSGRAAPAGIDATAPCTPDGSDPDVACAIRWLAESNRLRQPLH